MANTPSARKRVRQAETRRQLRSRQRSEARTAVKRLRALLDSGEKAKAEDLRQSFSKTASVLDRVSAKGTIPKTRAARYKSRLNTAIRKATGE